MPIPADPEILKMMFPVPVFYSRIPGDLTPGPDVKPLEDSIAAPSLYTAAGCTAMRNAIQAIYSASPTAQSTRDAHPGWGAFGPTPSVVPDANGRVEGRYFGRFPTGYWVWDIIDGAPKLYLNRAFQFADWISGYDVTRQRPARLKEIYDGYVALTGTIVDREAAAPVPPTPQPPAPTVNAAVTEVVPEVDDVGVGFWGLNPYNDNPAVVEDWYLMETRAHSVWYKMWMGMTMLNGRAGGSGNGKESLGFDTFDEDTTEKPRTNDFYAHRMPVVCDPTGQPWLVGGYALNLGVQYRLTKIGYFYYDVDNQRLEPITEDITTNLIFGVDTASPQYLYHNMRPTTSGGTIWGAARRKYFAGLVFEKRQLIDDILVLSIAAGVPFPTVAAYGFAPKFLDFPSYASGSETTAALATRVLSELEDNLFYIGLSTSGDVIFSWDGGNNAIANDSDRTFIVDQNAQVFMVLGDNPEDPTDPCGTYEPLAVISYTYYDMVTGIIVGDMDGPNYSMQDILDDASNDLPNDEAYYYEVWDPIDGIPVNQPYENGSWPAVNRYKRNNAADVIILLESP